MPMHPEVRRTLLSLLELAVGGLMQAVLLWAQSVFRAKQEYRDVFSNAPAISHAADDVLSDKERTAAIKQLHWTQDQYNIAFIGMVSAGKSTLVNALRGLRASDNVKGAPRGGNGEPTHGPAPTGEAETTLRATKYLDAEFPHIAYFDIAGSGGIAEAQGANVEAANKYFRNNCLELMDAVVLVYDTANLQVKKLVAEVLKHNLKLIVVKSRADVKINNAVENEGMELAAAVRHLNQTLKKDRQQLALPLHCRAFAVSQRGILGVAKFLRNKQLKVHDELLLPAVLCAVGRPNDMQEDLAKLMSEPPTISPEDFVEKYKATIEEAAQTCSTLNIDDASAFMQHLTELASIRAAPALE